MPGIDVQLVVIDVVGGVGDVGVFRVLSVIGFPRVGGLPLRRQALSPGRSSLPAA
jgi:hypothetical protein